jgi:PAS domain-containing protein
MKQRGCCPPILTILTLLCFVLGTVLSAGAQMKQTRRILIINDLGIVSSPGFAEIDQAIFSSLQNSPYQIELYHESLQLTLFPDEASRRLFRESLIRKYSERKLDLIMAAGSASLKFIAESHETFIKETPIVFCTVLGEIPDQLKSGFHVTGVLGRLQPEETFKAALHLLPAIKHVVVVGGMGTFDEEWERVAKRAFQNYESKFDFTYLTDLTMPVLLERLRHLPSNTIVYHTAITQDAAGARFIDSAQSVPLVASAANAPVFVMDDVDLRAGTVGGALVNWPDDARVAGDMAVQVLNGKRPEDIPIVMSNNTYMFDWRALKRWGLKESDLPPGSIVLNRQPTLWESYRWYIVGAVCLLLAQTSLIIGLLWQRSVRRKAEASRRESEQRFRLVANTAPVMIWMSGIDKLCNYFNKPWLDFTGRTLAQELGLGSRESLHPDDVQRFADVYADAQAARRAF